MSNSQQQTVSRLLRDLRAGNRQALDELFPLLYHELHQPAKRSRQRWGGDEGSL